MTQMVTDVTGTPAVEMMFDRDARISMPL